VFVDVPVSVPSLPAGVKLRRYFIVCTPAFVRRMSDSKSDDATPVACATAGTINESGGGVFLPLLETGVTMLTDTGRFTAVTSVFAPVDVGAAPYVTWIVPVFVPRLRIDGSAVTVSVRPSRGRIPLGGVTVSHGLSAFAVKLTGVDDPARKSFCTIFPGAPASPPTLRLFAGGCGGTMKMPMTSEYAPRSSLQLLIARTR